MAGGTFRILAVVGAGNMGSGIAQKMASEGFQVILVDLDDQKVARGLQTTEKTLHEGIERKLFSPERVAEILSRIRGTTRFEDLADVDLVVEAVFEDMTVKRDVFSRLERACRRDTILATNTSSFAVAGIAAGISSPDRVIGLHYFYHPAKNRLVEVVGGVKTSAEALGRAWTLQERLGKTPIRSKDSCGFIVNRFFGPWLAEAVRVLEEGIAGIPTIEAAAKQAFGIGMGPFELMNVTGIPIAVHTDDTLGAAFGPLHGTPERLRTQFESGKPWDLTGAADTSKFDAVADRLAGVTFYIASALVDEGVGTIEDTDIGARVGLRWRRGPFELMNHYGLTRAATLVEDVARRWTIPVPGLFSRQAASGKPFHFTLVRREDKGGVATLTIDRPDALNALNEAVMAQLGDAFRAATADPAVKGIVIAGSGKAFVAGADVRFFVRNIEAKNIPKIAQFTRTGQELLLDIQRSRTPVVARVHGLALGGGVELALACHSIVATPNATFAFPETGIGIYPGLGGTQRTTARVGRGLAKWLVLTGETVTAEQAAAIGLVDRVVPYEELDAAIRECIARGAVTSRTPHAVPDSFREIAVRYESADVESLRASEKRLGSKAPIALRIASDLIDRAEGTPIDKGIAMELSHLEEIFATADAYEGLSSLGKRRPVFKGA
ncbi:MAG TPA: 3-hydroxyacyl-CoA dehydrogenase NAD-binding domain-containing protein [Vicinamibacterales bacterium]|nr:3-hydroxyacyl-CoA dehydrogenase NAD-binding domain-containing protein [Vicinamibacterales bacterium]